MPPCPGSHVSGFSLGALAAETQAIYADNQSVHCRMEMSTPTGTLDLDAALRERGSAAYILTVDGGGAPHVVHAEVHRHGAHLIAAVGRHTADNAGSRPRVSILYPARDPASYSLIVDATASVAPSADGCRLLLAPTRAVLHRPAPAPDPAASPCGSDCVPVALTASPGAGHPRA